MSWFWQFRRRLSPPPAAALLTLSVAELSHRARLLEEVGGRPMPAVDWRLLLRPPDQIQAAFRQLCGILGPERARVTVAEDWSVLWADLDGIAWVRLCRNLHFVTLFF